MNFKISNPISFAKNFGKINNVCDPKENIKYIFEKLCIGETKFFLKPIFYENDKEDFLKSNQLFDFLKQNDIQVEIIKNSFKKCTNSKQPKYTDSTKNKHSIFDHCQNFPKPMLTHDKFGYPRFQCISCTEQIYIRFLVTIHENSKITLE